MVDKTEKCESYRKNPIKGEIIRENGNIFKVAENLVPIHLKSVPLECKAKNCIYNKEEQCTANGITVDDNPDNFDSADCATYCKN